MNNGNWISIKLVSTVLFSPGHEYVLEKQSEPGVPLDLEASLESMGTLEFVLTKGGRTYTRV
jgi:hypothetical protein